jgi:hypothetical protein
MESAIRASNARWGEARTAPPAEGGRERPPLMVFMKIISLAPEVL